MSCIYDMTPRLLRTVVTPDTVKIMKNFWHFRVRAWNFLHNGIQNFVFWLIHSWEIALQSQIFDIFLKKAQKKALALKVLIFVRFLFISILKYKGKSFENKIWICLFFLRYFDTKWINYIFCRKNFTMLSVWVLGDGQKRLTFATHKEIVQNPPIKMESVSINVVTHK